MNTERNDELSARNEAELASLPPNETPVSSDNRRLWLLAIGILAVLAVLAGNYPRSVGSNWFDPSGIGAVAIQAGGVHLVFVESTAAEVQAELTGSRSNDVTLNVSRTGDTLDVQVDRRFMLFRLFSFAQPTLTVSLPADFDADIRAQISSGSIRMDGLQRELGNVDLSSSSGRVSVRDTDFTGNVQIRTSSGRIDFEDAATPGEVDVSASSGRVILEGVRAGRYRLQTSSGRLSARGLSGAGLTATTSSGRLEIESETIVADWQLRASSGRVTVELERLPRDFALNFSGGSGGWSVADRYGFDTADARRNALSVRGSGPELSVRTGSGRFQLL